MTGAPSETTTSAANPPGDASPVLMLRNITKTFPGSIALKDVSFDVEAGEIHALVGENGAGKSTLMGVASGDLIPDTGTVTIGGRVVEHTSPAITRSLGLAIVHQRPAILPDLTVAENMALGVPPQLRPSWAGAESWAGRQLESMQVSIDPRQKAYELDVAQRHLVEIAKALASEPRVLIFDEPTEPLDEQAVEQLMVRIESIARTGVGVVYISHRLPEVERIAHRVTVLRDGANRGEFLPSQTSEILRIIVGRELDAEFPEKASRPATSVGLDVHGVLGVTTGLAAGQITGIAGIEGNGQREFVRSLAGLGGGSVDLAVAGRALRIDSPTAALAAGITYMPSDRHEEGLVAELPVATNLSLLTLRDVTRLGFIRRGLERAFARRKVVEFGVKTPSIDTPVQSLSGGNQQKVVFARSIAAKPQVLIADEPTQAVDAGARVDLYRHLRHSADEGATVLVNSSNARELEGLCDRVLVFSRGTIVADLDGDDLTEERITSAALTASTVRDKGDVGRRRRTSWLRGDYLPALLLLVLSILIAAYTASRSPNYLSAFNVTHVLLGLAGLGFIALGQYVVVLLGGVDLSVGPLAGLVAVMGSFLVAGSGGGVAVGLVLMALVAAFVGGVNGTMTRGLRISPVIATLVTFFALQGVSLLLRPSPGGSIDPALVSALQGIVGPVPVAFVVLVCVAVVLEFVMRRTVWGVQMRATGSNEDAAKRLGVPVDRRHIQAYVLCALLTFVGGVLLLAQIQVGDATAGVEYTLSSIAAVVIGGVSIFGGRGSALGVLCGALLLQQMLSVGTFLELESPWQYVFVGVVTLGAAGIFSRVQPAN